MKQRAVHRLNALTVAKMNRALLDGPCTLYDLVEACGLGYGAVGRYVRAMRLEGATHIAQWEQDSVGRFKIPAHVIGVGRDVPRPKTDRIKKSRQQRAARKKLMRINLAMAGQLETA